MRCSKCGCEEDKVIDSRTSREALTIRRRRECLACGHRFTTYEEIEHDGLMIIKRGGRMKEFLREKLLSGIKKACQKRPVSAKAIEEFVDRIMEDITQKFDAEVPSMAIGERVMEDLKRVDQIAYVRYASVYRRFQEVTDSLHEVKKLEEQSDPTTS